MFTGPIVRSLVPGTIEQSGKFLAPYAWDKTKMIIYLWYMLGVGKEMPSSALHVLDIKVGL